MKPKVTVFCKFLRQGGKLSVSFYKSPVEVDLIHDKDRHMTKIISNETQIATIREKLKERNIM